MGPRPPHLNLSNDRPDAFLPPKMPFANRDLPSPRAGEIPPALSPLDAFAMHSRLLAKKFDEETQNGRRMSRLPPTVVAKEMSSRPGYFRSISGESKMSDVAEMNEEGSPVSSRGHLMAEESPSKERPVSLYPMVETATRQREEAPPMPTPYFDAEERPTSSAKAGPDYFGMGMPRASSPEPVDSRLVNVQAPSPSDYPSLTSSIDTISSQPRTMTNDSHRSHRSQRSLTSDKGLAPPHSPRYPKSPRSFQSIRSVPADSGDEDGMSVSGSQAISSSRKFSGSSNMSRPQSPYSPWMQSVHRSPSMTSEYSMGGSQQPFRPAANFSRPMSSAGSRPSFDTRQSIDSRPSLDKKRPELPIRQASGASSDTDQSFKPAISRQGSDNDPEKMSKSNQPPIDAIVDPAATPDANASSYIYAKYALGHKQPQGRDSQAFRDSWIQKQFEWDRNHLQHERAPSGFPVFDAQARASPAASDMGRPSRSLTPNPSEARSLSADPRPFDRTAAMHRSSPSVKTTSTDRTVKAAPLHQKSASADLSAEEHLDIGIICHQAGETNKSTYHLRLAAIAGLPTAMLMYGLACRHGWGMRANQEEGVKWLRKAIDVSGLDVEATEEKLNAATNPANMDPVQRKARKAQYALAIFELGQSSMHGWGCPKDKGTALRCYEIAGEMGDGDALSSAAECYASGTGCKKDLRKAASLYRKAADKGVSMAGNSWIYKEKYMVEVSESTDKKRPDTAGSKETKKEDKRDDKRDDKKDDKKDDKSSGRARSRSIWGRSKKEKDREPQPTMPATGRLQLD